MTFNAIVALILACVLLVVVVVIFSYTTVEATAPTANPETVTQVKTEPVLTRTEIIYDIPLSEDLQLFTQALCRDYQLDCELVFAIMQIESNFNAKAFNSNSGCVGLMQINPINLPELVEKFPTVYDLYNPYDNITGGVYLLKKCFEQLPCESKDDASLAESLALMIYNCGRNCAFRFIKAGCYETSYTAKVLEAKANLKIKEKIYYSEVVEIEHYN